MIDHSKPSLNVNVHDAKPTVSALSDSIAVNVPLPGDPTFNVMTLFISDMSVARAVGEALMREAFQIERLRKARAVVPSAEEIGLPSLVDA